MPIFSSKRSGNLYLYGTRAMFDNFLTSILQIIVVLDVLAIVTYVVLGGRKRTSVEQRQPMFPRTVRAIAHRLGRHREHVVPAGATDFANLKSVLYSFREGLV